MNEDELVSAVRSTTRLTSVEDAETAVTATLNRPQYKKTRVPTSLFGWSALLSTSYGLLTKVIRR